MPHWSKPKAETRVNDPRWNRRRAQFVYDFQRAFNLPPDAMPGRKTFQKLAELAKTNGFTFEDDAANEYNQP